MENKEINPRIWKENATFLKTVKFEKDNSMYQYEGTTGSIIDHNESITPTTDGGYLNINAVKDKLQDYLSLDDIFIKRYQFKESNTSDVLRFGINTKHLSTLVKDHNEKQHIPSVLTSNTNNFKDISKGTLLHSLEKTSLKTAIEFLQATDNKTTLVDVLKRDADRKITDTQDTHTVVLYNTGNKILVIDPSNPQFSSHLANYANYIEVDYSNKNKIYAPIDENSNAGKALKTKYGNITGINHEQYRDCIDIAVKIAFILNNENKVYQELKQIYQSDNIKYISNEDVLDKTIFYKKDIVNKLKQTSDIIKVKQYNLVQQAFDKKTKMILKDFPDLKDKYYNLYNDNTSVYNDSTVKNLLDLNKSLTSDLTNALNQNDIELAGSIEKINENLTDYNY